MAGCGNRSVAWPRGSSRASHFRVPRALRKRLPGSLVPSRDAPHETLPEPHKGSPRQPRPSCVTPSEQLAGVCSLCSWLPLPSGVGSAPRHLLMCPRSTWGPPAAHQALGPAPSPVPAVWAARPPRRSASAVGSGGCRAYPVPPTAPEPALRPESRSHLSSNVSTSVLSPQLCTAPWSLLPPPQGSLGVPGPRSSSGPIFRGARGHLLPLL